MMNDGVSPCDLADTPLQQGAISPSHTHPVHLHNSYEEFAFWNFGEVHLSEAFASDFLAVPKICGLRLHLHLHLNFPTDPAC